MLVLGSMPTVDLEIPHRKMEYGTSTSGGRGDISSPHRSREILKENTWRSGAGLALLCGP